MSFLVIATLTATLLTVTVSAFYFVVAFNNDPVHPISALLFVLFTALGVAPGVAIIWSDLHEGRGRGLGLFFAAVYFWVSIFFLGVLHFYWPLALVLLVIAGWNSYKWGDR